MRYSLAARRPENNVLEGLYNCPFRITPPSAELACSRKDSGRARSGLPVVPLVPRFSYDGRSTETVSYSGYGCGNAGGVSVVLYSTFLKASRNIIGMMTGEIPSTNNETQNVEHVWAIHL